MLIVSILISAKLFPWDLLPYSFKIMQFPWRFETFVALFISLLAPMCLKLIKDPKIISYILCTFIVLMSQPMLNQFGNVDVDKNIVEFHYGLGWQFEYFPVKVFKNKEHFDNVTDISIVKGIGVITTIENNTPYLKFEVNGDLTIELPRIYYLGYTLTNEHGKEYELYENDYGFIEAEVNSGVYYLNYTGTKLDQICNIVSVISIIGLGVLVLWKRK